MSKHYFLKLAHTGNAAMPRVINHNSPYKWEGVRANG